MSVVRCSTTVAGSPVRLSRGRGGGYPLGANRKASNAATEIALAPGDRIVLCSDGLVEAANAREGIFGFERVAETIPQGCAAGLPAAALIDHLIGAAQAFAGGVPQRDDMTCVILRVGETLSRDPCFR